MSDLALKVEELAESLVPEIPTYKPSDKEKEVVMGVFNLFRESADERDMNYQYFDGSNLIDYINDSVRRFVTNVDERDDIEDWQARIHDPFTRNKILAILGRVIDAMPIAEIVGRGSEDYLKAEIGNSLLEYADDKSDVEEFMVYAVEEALVKGTMVGYEGVETFSKDVRDVVKYKNGDNITVKKSTMKIRRLINNIVPLEEFYPSSVGIRKIDDMPYCFWRKEMPYPKFLKDYSNYAQAQFVQPFSDMGEEAIYRPFYQDYITTGTRLGSVEVIKYFNQETDEYVILANGIWLNPLKSEIVSPIPFNHKRLPFWSFRYDIFGSDFFYGKSLADKLKTLQDVLNVLNNMLLDQSFLSIFPPILMAGQDDIEDDFLRPGRRIPVDTGGLPINQVYQKLDIGTPTGWHQYILEYTRKILEESSMDSIQQGVAGVGGRTTATEIRSAAAGVVSLIGLFSRFVKFGARDRVRLRFPNILQFYTEEGTPILEGVLGVGGSKKTKKAFNTFQVDSYSITPGMRGTKIIDIYAKEQDLPTKKNQQLDAKLSELESGKKVTKFSVTADYIRNFDFDIRIIANPKSESSREVDRALEIQFQQTFLSLYSDIANRKEMAADLATKFGKDPSKVLNEQAFAQQLPPEQAGEDSMMPGAGGDNSANVLKGATGVGGEGVTMRGMSNGQ